MDQPTTVVSQFKGVNVSGFETIDCSLVHDHDAAVIRMKYVIIAPFVNRGEVRWLSWCWDESYSLGELQREAKEAADKIARQMWGEL